MHHFSVEMQTSSVVVQAVHVLCVTQGCNAVLYLQDETSWRDIITSAPCLYDLGTYKHWGNADLHPWLVPARHGVVGLKMDALASLYVTRAKRLVHQNSCLLRLDIIRPARVPIGCQRCLCSSWHRMFPRRRLRRHYGLVCERVDMKTRQAMLTVCRPAENVIHGAHVIQGRRDARIRVRDEGDGTVREDPVEVRQFLLVHAKWVDVTHDWVDDLLKTFLLGEWRHLKVNACLSWCRREKAVELAQTGSSFSCHTYACSISVSHYVNSNALQAAWIFAYILWYFL